MKPCEILRQFLSWSSMEEKVGELHIAARTGVLAFSLTFIAFMFSGSVSSLTLTLKRL